MRRAAVWCHTWRHPAGRRCRVIGIVTVSARGHLACVTRGIGTLAASEGRFRLAWKSRNMVCYQQVQFYSKERGYETKPFCLHGGDGNRRWDGVVGAGRGRVHRVGRHARHRARLLREPEDEDRCRLRVPESVHAAVAPLRRGRIVRSLRVHLHQQWRRLFVVLEEQLGQLLVDIRAGDGGQTHDHPRRAEQEDPSCQGRQRGDQPDDGCRHGHFHVPAGTLRRHDRQVRLRSRQQVQGEDLFVQDLRERRAGDGCGAVARNRRLVCVEGRIVREGLSAHDGQCVFRRRRLRQHKRRLHVDGRGIVGLERGGELAGLRRRGTLAAAVGR